MQLVSLASLSHSAAAASVEVDAPAQAAMVPAKPAPRTWQPFDYTAMVAAVGELRHEWLPAKVEQVVQPDGTSLALKLRTLTASGWLYLSWHPVSGRLSTGAPPDTSRARAYSFGEQLHAQLRGLVLVEAEMLQRFERCAALRFGQRPGEPASLTLVVEVMGRYSNVMLTQPGGELLLCAYQVGGRMSSLRQLQIGGTYQLPPPGLGLSPSAEESFEQWRDNVTGAAGLASPRKGSTAAIGWATGCVRAYRGVSPSLTRELALLAGVPPELPPSAVSGEQWAALHQQWRGWLQALEEGSFRPSTSLCGGNFSLLGAYPRPAPGSVLQLLDEYYGTHDGAERYNALRQQLQRQVANALKKVRSKRVALEVQLELAAAAPETRKLADMLMANAYSHVTGARSIALEDWDTGATVQQPLEQGQGPVEAAEKLYKRARKQERAVAYAVPLLEGAAGEEAYVTEVEVALAQLGPFKAAEDLAALREIQEELIAGGYVRCPPEVAALAKKPGGGKAKRAAKGAKRGGAAAVASAFREYASPNGFRVLVGRNNRQNDRLTHDVAAGSDRWLHARGVPGAHVLLCVRDANEPGDEDLQFAANLAAWWSKTRAENRVPVIVADIKDVKRAKGGTPGRVMVAKERVVVGVPSASAAALAGEE